MRSCSATSRAWPSSSPLRPRWASGSPSSRPESGELPERFDGQRTLKDAAALTRLDEFEAAKIACALLFLGLLRKAEAREAAAPPPEEEEVDLAQTARMAFDPGSAKGAAEPEPAFFVPDAEPAQAEPAEGEGEAVDITMADSPAPQFGDSETPPLGLSVPSPQAFSPASLLQPDPEPEGAPTVVGFNVGEVEADPRGFSFSESDDVTSPRLDFVVSPPQTAALDRIPGPAPVPVPDPVAAPVPAPAPPPPPPPPPPTPITFTPAAAVSPAPLAFEEEPAREPVAPARPSKEDLAALDALLNPSASMRSTSLPTSKPRAERWEPQFRSGPTTPISARPNRRRGGFPVVPVAAGATILFAVAGGAWYYFNQGPPKPPKQVVRATPRPAPSTTLAVAPSPNLPPPDSLPTAVASPTVAASPLPATPAPTLAPVPTPVAPVPTTPAPKPVPTPKPATKAAGGGLAEARQLLEKRDYGAAARGFASSVRSSSDARFSVQLLVACSEETVGKAVANASGPDLLILPVNYKGKSCYRLCWGLYESEARASSALGSVPAYFRENGAKPKVSPTAGLLP